MFLKKKKKYCQKYIVQINNNNRSINNNLITRLCSSFLLEQLLSINLLY